MEEDRIGELVESQSEHQRFETARATHLSTVSHGTELNC